jgi:hypothetical protein
MRSFFFIAIAYVRRGKGDTRAEDIMGREWGGGKGDGGRR